MLIPFTTSNIKSVQTETSPDGKNKVTTTIVQYEIPAELASFATNIEAILNVNNNIENVKKVSGAIEICNKILAEIDTLKAVNANIETIRQVNAMKASIETI